MKILQLAADFYNTLKNIKAYFSCDKKFDGLVHDQKGTRWSKTVKSQSFQKADFNLNTFHDNVKGEMFIYYSHLEQVTPQIKKQASFN